MDKKDILEYCPRFTVSGTSEQKLVSNNILVTAEIVSAAASVGYILQLILPKSSLPSRSGKLLLRYRKQAHNVKMLVIAVTVYFLV